METWVVMREPFGRYEISDAGNIRRRINMAHPERSKKFSHPKPFESKGVMRVALNDGQKVTVSRMVFEAFVDDLSDGFVIAHLNGNYKDNRAANLAQVSQMENIHHKKLHGTWQAGPTHPNSKPAHSYDAADKVREALASAKRTPLGYLARGERIRVAKDIGVDVSFLDTVSKGGWSKHDPHHRN